MREFVDVWIECDLRRRSYVRRQAIHNEPVKKKYVLKVDEKQPGTTPNKYYDRFQKNVPLLSLFK